MSDSLLSRLEPDRHLLTAVRRITVKVGTGVIAGPEGVFSEETLRQIVAQVARARREGREVLLVSSGAVALGAEALGFRRPPTSLDERQACAAIGQSRLMHHYERAFREEHLVTAQVLLTGSDFDGRARYLNLRSTLTTLLGHGVVPILNENDAVSVRELAYSDDAADQAEGAKPVFGDNDRLSALIASKLEADLLVLLTDVEGLYDRDPRLPDARLVPHVATVSDSQTPGVTVGQGSSWGRGGMHTKIEAARVAARAGCHAVIAPGYRADAVDAILGGEQIGTWFPARPREAARRRWIAFATRSRGTLELDEGAVAALRERGASLLAAGVRAVRGDFERGDVVELRSPSGSRVGRGIIYCDSESARSWCAGERPAGARNHHALVHRDHLVLEDTMLEATQEEDP